jgi:hypothetical protein
MRRINLIALVAIIYRYAQSKPRNQRIIRFAGFPVNHHYNKGADKPVAKD